MSLQGATLNFAAVLASSIHDMKNSLGMVLNSLDGIVDGETGECRCSAGQVAQLQYEAKRINDNLIQLLTIYKVEQEFYRPELTEVVVAEFLDECRLGSKPLLDHQGVALELVCDPDLVWYFDTSLMAGVIDNIITNAIRYTSSRIRLSAQLVADDLEIAVDDDGPGFPVSMLGTEHAMDRSVDLVRGRTRLGLFFCAMVAGLHSNGGRTGGIDVVNDGVLGGGRFLIRLP